MSTCPTCGNSRHTDHALRPGYGLLVAPTRPDDSGEYDDGTLLDIIRERISHCADPICSRDGKWVLWKLDEAICAWTDRCIEATDLLQRLEKQTQYSITLQRIIEAICHGHELPASAKDLYHYEMAAEFIAKNKA